MSSGDSGRFWWERFQARLNQRGAWINIIFVPGPVFIGIGLTPVFGWEWYLSLGITLFVLAVGYAGVLAWQTYPRSLDFSQAMGKTLTLVDLENLPSGTIVVALIGAGAVGKTTLREHLAQLAQANTRTFNAELTVHPAPPPVDGLAYLDAAGEDLTQQFLIMDRANILILLLDHQEGKIVFVSDERKRTQGFNVTQFANKIRERQRDGRPVSAVHILYNKHDLWAQCGNSLRNLKAWFEEQTQKVAAVMPSDKVTHADHSNERADDIAAVRTQILHLANEILAARRA